jgi:hypothetical protein
VVGRVQHPVVGHRPDPRARRQRRTERRPGLGGRTQVDGAGPTLGAAQHVEAHVGGDAIEPGGQRATRRIEAGGVLPGPQQGLLDGVLGLGGCAEHPVRVPGQFHPELFHLEPHPGHGTASPGSHG